MKLKERIYRRFCAPEVRMLLAHMEENFEDFVDDYVTRKPWVKLMERKEYTTIEQATLRMAYTRLKNGYAREQLLGKIIAQKLNPEPQEKAEGLYQQDPKTAMLQQDLANHMAQHKQHLAQNMLAAQYNGMIQRNP